MNPQLNYLPSSGPRRLREQLLMQPRLRHRWAWKTASRVLEEHTNMVSDGGHLVNNVQLVRMDIRNKGSQHCHSAERWYECGSSLKITVFYMEQVIQGK